MNYAHYIRELGRGRERTRDLSLDEARQLYGAMLDGGVPELELGAIAIALRLKGESVDEMVGFLDALNERHYAMQCPQGRLRPVVIPSYNGARKGVNLTPLLALLLKRYRIPVLVHGLIEGYGRVTSAQVFREFGLMPCSSFSQGQQTLDESGFAFVPLSAISPRFGPTNRSPSASSTAWLRRTAGCDHMAGFIAGAISTGTLVASRTADARSFASPCAALAIRSAVAGATTIRSGSRARRICPTSCSSCRSNRSVNT